MPDLTKDIYSRSEQQIRESSQPGLAPVNPCIPFTREEVERSVPERFADVVRRFPNQFAIQMGKQRLTYQELDKVSNQVTHAILARCEASEQPVAVLGNHGVTPIIALLGILKAGKGYIVLDATHPQARLVDILREIQPDLMITNSHNVHLATELIRERGQLIHLEALDASIPDHKVTIPISPNSLAALFCTSGSSGRSKIVVWNHRFMLHMAWRNTNDYQIRPEDHYALLFSYDVSTSPSVIWAALLNGATLYPYNIKAAELTRLLLWFRDEDVTILHPPVSLFRQLLDLLRGIERFPNMRLIILGSQTLYRHDVEKFRTYFPGHCLLVHSLGLTETGRISQFFVTPHTEIPEYAVPVGYPTTDKEVLLWDEAGQPVGFDHVGEIAVKSRYLSPGYWNDPDLTRQKFLPDPDGSDKQIYLTGDLGRMRPDGCLNYLGRKDFQVKIRGYQVVLTEIEAILCHLEAVIDAVVIAHAKPTGEQFLVAYIVPSRQPAPNVSELRRAMAEILPEYMIPSVFIMLDALPLTPLGKVDRQALSAPDVSRPELDTTFVSPQDPLELRINRVWEQVLAVHPIGVHDNFFDLGGDSIVALCLVAQIEKALGKALPLPTLLQAPTIAQLAEVLRQKGWAPSWSSLVAIQPDGSNPPFFCVPPAAVTALYFVNLARYLGPDQPFYSLQPLGIDRDDVAPHTRVEDMATYYLNEIRQFQPEGPYYLGGQCFGGIVAFEMAQQLVAQGQPVALLAILDTKFPPGVVASAPSPDTLIQHYWQRGRRAWHEGEFWRLGGRKLKHWLRKYGTRKRLARLWQWVVSPIAGAIARLQVWDTMKMPQRLRIQRVEQAHHAARQAYVPRVYPGKITFFWSRDTRRGQRKRWAHWSTEALEIHVFPGRHHTMLQEPHIRVVAEQLRVCIEQAQAASIQVQTRSHPQRDASRQPDAEDRT